MSVPTTPAFHDLADPMAFVTTKGFGERNVTRVKKYGASLYFYGDQGEWYVTTPPCKVLTASVNEFKEGEHVLGIACPPEWAETMTQQLKEAVRQAHPEMLQSGIPFEQVWERCHKPKFNALEIRSKYKAKRSKVFDYVNMYNKDKEITGSCNLCSGSVVQCSLRFVLSEQRHEDGDVVETGFRCDFGAGIRVLKLSGKPAPIKRPWNWSSVDFDTLASPMYDTVCVNTGSMGVTSVEGRVVTVEPKAEFKAAMRDFHARADADEWDDTIVVKKSIEPGRVAVATVVPSRNKRHITWTATSLHTSQKKRRKMSPTPEVAAAVAAHEPETVAAKKDADNTDSSFGSQTSD